MAYRRPGVQVTQEFVGLVPALAGFNLPSCAIGPAYQVVEEDDVGSYAGSAQSYAYASLMPGAVVDTEELASDEVYPATKYPVVAKLKNTKVEIVAAQLDGRTTTTTTLTDPTAGQYAKVLAGDIVKFSLQEGVTVVEAQTNGQTSDTAGQRDRLTAGTPGQYADVKVGDSVVVTGGTNSTPGTYTVLSKPSADVLKLSAEVNTGSGPSTDVAYSVTGNRGADLEVKVKSKTDDNTLVLETPVAAEAPLAYEVYRKLGTVELDRVASGNGYTVDAAAVSLSEALTVDVLGDDMPVLEADVVVSYRALRNDLAAGVREYTKFADLQAVFGTDQVVPANPLAYALSVMLQNTVTPINGLGLSELAADDEASAYTQALDVLKLTDMYALAPLTQNPVVHTAFKNHVEQLSLPGAKLERCVLVNGKLQTTGVIQDEQTTVTTESASRDVVAVQVDGAGAVASPDTLTDPTSGQFDDVEPGDTVVVTGGTGVTSGSYEVLSKPSAGSLKLDGDFITTGNPADITYYVVRKDGLGADGKTFYDRSASFLSNGVAAGHMLNILSGPQKGRWKIATVDSERQLTLAAAVTGVTSLKTAVEYQVDRDLTKSEQALVVKGYSESFALRRVVNVWSDVVEAPVGQEVVELPGYFACAAIAALTTGLPTHQGFTNLALSGFLGIRHSTRYFTEDQLNTIADGGTMILAQDGPQQPLYIRHQLTTDRSAIKFQEFSITKNVDFIAKFMRNAFRGFIGRYNIVETTLDELKSTATAVITFLQEKTRLPKIGGVIRSGTLASLTEDETQIDTVLMRFVLNIPVPLNNIDITVQV